MPAIHRPRPRVPDQRPMGSADVPLFFFLVAVGTRVRPCPVADEGQHVQLCLTILAQLLGVSPRAVYLFPAAVHRSK